MIIRKVHVSFVLMNLTYSKKKVLFFLPYPQKIKKAALSLSSPPFHYYVNLTYENELPFEFLFISEIQRLLFVLVLPLKNNKDILQFFARLRSNSS